MSQNLATDLTGVIQLLPGAALFPPVLSPKEFARMVDRSPHAIYHWRGTTKLHGAARKRGRHVLIWRDRALTLAMGGSVPKPRGDSIELIDAEINAAFATNTCTEKWPLLLSPSSLAAALGVGRSSIYRWLAFGYLKGTFVKRSDGIRFTRNSILKALFNGDVWI